MHKIGTANPLALRASTGIGCLLMSATLILFALTAGAQSSEGGYDQALLPIQPQALKLALSDAAHDPVKLYSLVRRADRQGLSDAAYDILNEMRHKQSKNADVIAAYCFSFQVAAGEYDDPNRNNRPFTEAELRGYAEALEKAYQLDPKLWLTYVVEGHASMSSPYEDQKALRLLKTAIRLAPNVSYTHTLLAEAYGVYGTPYHSFQASAQECDIARHLKPASAKNADILFDIYDIRTPNREKATEAKQYLLSTVPPTFALKPAFLKRLAMY